VLLTPKYLHHHRPATSALEDMTSGTFFNRVIDDGKARRLRPPAPSPRAPPSCAYAGMRSICACRERARAETLGRARARRPPTTRGTARRTR